MMTLFDSPFSPFTRKVRLALAHKQLAFESVDGLDLAHLPRLKQVNPRGEVPVLVDGGISVVNSADIIEYLEERYPEPSVWPGDPAMRVKAREWQRICDTLLDAILHDISLSLRPLNLLPDDEAFPNVKAWIRRMRIIPAVKDDIQMARDAPVLDGAGFGSSEVATADNGGHECLYVLDTGSRPLREVVEEISALVAAVEGVEHVVTDYTTPSRADLGLDHPNAGQLVLFAEDGFRFTDPDETANPLPGNHGHVTTQASTLMIVGGHPVLQGPCTVPLGFVPATLSQPVNAPGNLSIAPTAAALYGLPAPARGCDGSVLAEAFTPDCGQ